MTWFMVVMTHMRRVSQLLSFTVSGSSLGSTAHESEERAGRRDSGVVSIRKSSWRNMKPKIEKK